jgi:hypothetical protein
MHTTRSFAMPRISLPRLARSLAIAAAVAVATITAAVPVAATSPTVDEVQLVRLIPNKCPDFPILATFHVARRVTTFYDADGTPIRQTIHASLAGSSTQNLLTGFTIELTGVRYIETDLVTGEVKSTGTNAHAILPGEGTLQIGAGITITDDGHVVFDAGRLDPPASPAVCAALAG